MITTMHTKRSKGFTPQQSARGFTLVELIVSVGLFALVMLIVTGAYFSLIALDRRARATNQVVSNLSFAMDTMMRGIRTGTNFRCIDGSPDTDGNSTNGNCHSFSYTDTILSKTVTYISNPTNNTIGRCEGPLPCTNTNASPLTDSTITIQTLTFYVRGAGTNAAPNWSQQPHVTFVVSGVIASGNTCPNVIADTKGNIAGNPTCSTTVPFTLQQASTQRLIDY